MLTTDSDSISTERSGAEKAIWYKAPFPPAMASAFSSRIGPNITAIGLGYLEYSQDVVSDRNYLVTGLQVLEDVYNTRRNYSELVTNYVYTNIWDNRTVL